MNGPARLLSGNAVATGAERAEFPAEEVLAGRCVRLVTTRATLVNGAVSMRRLGSGVVVAFEAEFDLRAY
jgi:hypothetical protein